MLIAYFLPEVTLFDAFVIYLSAGAPFGVLVFLGRQNDRFYRAVARATIAIGFWPILAASRLGRLAGRRIRIGSPSETNSNQINSSSSLTDAIPRSHREIFDRFTTLSDLANATADEPAELFAIAGHPNPMLATVCNARRRRPVIQKHLAEARKAMDELQSEFESPAVSELDGPVRSKPEPVQTLYGSLQA